MNLPFQITRTLLHFSHQKKRTKNALPIIKIDCPSLRASRIAISGNTYHHSIAAQSNNRTKKIKGSAIAGSKFFHLAPVIHTTKVALEHVGGSNTTVRTILYILITLNDSVAVRIMVVTRRTCHKCVVAKCYRVVA
jgi:hypothetical protein